MAISRKWIGATVSALSLACAAAYADSTPLSEPHTSVVHFKDLNLDQPRDVARLYNRISFAADRVCGPRSYGGYSIKAANYQACYSDVIARAVAQINRPSVKAYFDERSAEATSHQLRVAQQ